MHDHRDDYHGPPPFVTWALLGLASWFVLAALVLGLVEAVKALGALL